ncbi:flagellar hook-associated protein FlgK [soil metagenome]
MSTFGSINTALSGLLAHRQALDIIGHNITNTSTDGYSRRRVELSPMGTWSVPALYARPTVSGGGVGVDGVTRIRDEFLEMQALREHGSAARLGTEAEMLTRIEQTVPEPSDVGMAAQLGDFFAAFDDVANTPKDSAARIALLQQASTVASSLNRVSAEMTNTRKAAIAETATLVSQVNSSAKAIAELNDAIAQATAAGLDPHDLSDERDKLVMGLSDLIGVQARAGENGTVDVTLGGTTLVRGNKAQQLQLAETTPLTGAYAGTGLNKVEVQWAIDGYPAVVTEGRVAGLLNTANKHVPQAMTELNSVAASLVTTVNALHQTGQGLDTVNDVSLNFWDPAGMTAETIKISTDIAGQPSRIAAASLGAGPLDATIAQKIAALHTASGGPSDVYQAMIGRLAVETQATGRRSEIQGEVAAQSDDARLSVSGVNLDEELTNLITTQRAYEASARLLTTVDETLDTLINRTGLVGR